MAAQNDVDLRQIARQAMVELGFAVEFSAAALAELSALDPAPELAEAGVRDLRSRLWCSIDNDSTRDLDQLTVAERVAGGAVIVCVAVADVDASVRRGSALDAHAERNTTSVYTAVETFPMLPERLSTDLTSLREGVGRLAVVVELRLGPKGELEGADFYRAAVHNYAKLTYDGVSAWLNGEGPLPERAARAGEAMAAQLRLQDEVAGKMRVLRHENGALALEVSESRGEGARARALIEDFMIGANAATAGYLSRHGLPSLRRIVREPKRWDRIVELARGHGANLPAAPDAKALASFLEARRHADPIRFADLSLAIVKLLGKGENVVELPGATSLGHFGLAVRDYAHSTAPNRRFTDLITQRILKAALAGVATPYAPSELARLAAHCTAQEDAANKVERRLRKSAMAQSYRDRIGAVFPALVTGAAAKGTWVRLLASPPVEGKLVRGERGVDVGDEVVVRLLRVDVARGFIDFERA